MQSLESKWANYFEACLLSLSMRSKRHVFSSTAMKSYINCTSNGRKRVLFKNYSIMLKKNWQSNKNQMSVNLAKVWRKIKWEHGFQICWVTLEASDFQHSNKCKEHMICLAVGSDRHTHLLFKCMCILFRQKCEPAPVSSILYISPSGFSYFSCPVL